MRFLVSLLLFCSLTRGEMLCDKGWQRGGAKCLKSIEGRFTFTAATQKCGSQGGKLTKVESDLDALRLTKLINLTPSRSGWIGVYKDGNTFIWQIDQSEVVKYASAFSSTHCLALITGNALVRPIACNRKATTKLMALCEKTLTCDSETSDCETSSSLSDITTVGPEPETTTSTAQIETTTIPTTVEPESETPTSTAQIETITMPHEELTEEPTTQIETITTIPYEDFYSFDTYPPEPEGDLTSSTQPAAIRQLSTEEAIHAEEHNVTPPSTAQIETTTTIPYEDPTQESTTEEELTTPPPTPILPNLQEGDEPLVGSTLLPQTVSVPNLTAPTRLEPPTTVLPLEEDIRAEEHTSISRGRPTISDGLVRKTMVGISEEETTTSGSSAKRDDKTESIVPFTSGVIGGAAGVVVIIVAVPVLLKRLRHSRRKSGDVAPKA